MGITVRERDGSYHVDAILGGGRVRGSLGTENEKVADFLKSRLAMALAEGPRSTHWPELAKSLPPKTFKRFADHADYKEQPAKPPATWALLRYEFEARLEERVKLRKLAPRSKDGGMEESTKTRYENTLREFEAFLAEENKLAEENRKRDQQIKVLEDIKESTFERYEPWRLERIAARKYSRGGTGIDLDCALLHAVFAFAVKKGMLANNPAPTRDPGANPTRKTVHFSSEELSKLRNSAGELLFAVLLFLWTGFRISDTVRLAWQDIDFDREEIVIVPWKTRRLGKTVFLPIHSELLAALRAERYRRNPQPTDRVLLHPRTGEPMTAKQLYHLIKDLGRRAGVANTHPHRFRDTFAGYLFGRGASISYVAELLGDTEETIRGHYKHFLPDVRDKLRGLIE